MVGAESTKTLTNSIVGVDLLTGVNGRQSIHAPEAVCIHDVVRTIQRNCLEINDGTRTAWGIRWGLDEC